jgi:hypothetical protein
VVVPFNAPPTHFAGGYDYYPAPPHVMVPTSSSMAGCNDCSSYTPNFQNCVYPDNIEIQTCRCNTRDKPQLEVQPSTDTATGGACQFADEGNLNFNKNTSTNLGTVQDAVPMPVTYDWTDPTGYRHTHGAWLWDLTWTPDQASGVPNDPVYTTLRVGIQTKAKHPNGASQAGNGPDDKPAKVSQYGHHHKISYKGYRYSVLLANPRPGQWPCP